MNEVNRKVPMLKMVVLILNADQAHIVSKHYEDFHFHVQYQFHAEGTATSKMLDMFGLGGTEKVITISILPGFVIPEFMSEAAKEFRLDRPGGGIIFTIPLSGIAGKSMAIFNEEKMKKYGECIEKEVRGMKNEYEYHLVTVAAEQGYSEEIMETAKQAGARGGTVWDIRKSGNDAAMQLLGLTTQDAQEIIIMLVEREKRFDIMKAVNDKHGVRSEAHGIVFSLPVEHVMGLGNTAVEE